MIPLFDDNGYLPPGVHPATLDEIKDRFGSESELRRVQMESLNWLVELARRAGVARLVINGSFTTNAFEPNDVDCVLLIEDVFPATRLLVEKFFATDRHLVNKGMVEVIL